MKWDLSPAVDKQERISFLSVFVGLFHFLKTYPRKKRREELRQAGEEKGQKGREIEEDKKERKIPKLAWLIEQDWKQMHSHSDVI